MAAEAPRDWPSNSKHILQRHLNLPHWQRRAGYAPKRSCAQARSRIRELRRVEGVEKLTSEHQPVRFEPRHGEGFRGRKIPGLCSGPHQRVSRRVAVVQNGPLERRRIEPQRRPRVRNRNRLARYKIRPFPKAVVVLRIAALGNVERESAGGRNDSTELPSAQNRACRRVKILAEGNLP